MYPDGRCGNFTIRKNGRIKPISFASPLELTVEAIREGCAEIELLTRIYGFVGFYVTAAVDDCPKLANTLQITFKLNQPDDDNLSTEYSEGFRQIYNVSPVDTSFVVLLEQDEHGHIVRFATDMEPFFFRQLLLFSPQLYQLNTALKETDYFLKDANAFVQKINKVIFDFLKQFCPKLKTDEVKEILRQTKGDFNALISHLASMTDADIGSTFLAHTNFKQMSVKNKKKNRDIMMLGLVSALPAIRSSIAGLVHLFAVQYFDEATNLANFGIKQAAYNTYSGKNTLSFKEFSNPRSKQYKSAVQREIATQLREQEIFNEFAGQRKRILIVNAGDGRNIPALKDEFPNFDFWVLEPVLHFASKCDKTISRKILVMTVQELPEDVTFDAIFISSYNINSDERFVFSKMYHALKEGGLLVIGQANSDPDLQISKHMMSAFGVPASEIEYPGWQDDDGCKEPDYSYLERYYRVKKIVGPSHVEQDSPVPDQMEEYINSRNDVVWKLRKAQFKELNRDVAVRKVNEMALASLREVTALEEASVSPIASPSLSPRPSPSNADGITLFRSDGAGSSEQPDTVVVDDEETKQDRYKNYKTLDIGLINQFLIRAASEGKTHYVRLLLKAGADPNGGIPETEHVAQLSS